MAILLWIIAVLFILVGLAGIVLPALPGTVLVFLGMLIAAGTDDFQRVGWATMTVLGILTLLSLVLDYVVAGLGAKRAGATREAITGAAIGTAAGLFFGLPGVVFGPFLGAVIGEYVARRDAASAGRAGFGAWLGMVLGVAVKLALAFTMIGIFILAYILGG